MKRNFLSFIALVFFALDGFSQTSGNFVSATLKPGSSATSVYVVIKSSTTLTASKFSTFQFALGIAATIVPVATASVVSLDPLISYPAVQVTQETQSATLFNVYSFSGDGAQSGGGTTYTAGVEYNIAEVFFSGNPSTTATVRIMQIPAGGLSNGNDNFFVADRGFDVTNQPVQFYSSVPANVSNDGLGYDGSSYASLANVLLPIRLTNFSAVKKDKDAILSWQVQSQDANSSHFELERGFTGTDFFKIGRVDVNLNSGSAATYSFNDVNIASSKSNGVIFYRIKLIDKDGKFTYSQVRSIKITSKAFGVNLYPNPAKGFSNITIELENPTPITLSVSDAGGKLVQKIEFSGNKGLNQKRIELSKLASGTYSIKVNAANDIQTASLLKE